MCRVAESGNRDTRQRGTGMRSIRVAPVWKSADGGNGGPRKRTSKLCATSALSSMSSQPQPPSVANDGSFLARFVADAAEREAAAAKCRRDAALEAQKAALVRQKQAAAAAAALRRSTAAAATMAASASSAQPVDSDNATSTVIASEEQAVAHHNEAPAAEPTADLICTPSRPPNQRSLKIILDRILVASLTFVI